jgi:hypothetical protein
LVIPVVCAKHKIGMMISLRYALFLGMPPVNSKIEIETSCYYLSSVISSSILYNMVETTGISLPFVDLIIINEGENDITMIVML